MKSLKTIEPIQKKYSLLKVDGMGRILRLEMTKESLIKSRFVAFVNYEELIYFKNELRNEFSIKRDLIRTAIGKFFGLEIDGDCVDANTARAEVEGLRSELEYKIKVTKFSGRRRHRGNVLRNIKTTAERRMAKSVVKEDGEPDFRGKRRNIPNAWDDIVSDSYRIRSWKYYRKTRWKSNKNDVL